MSTATTESQAAESTTTIAGNSASLTTTIAGDSASPEPTEPQGETVTVTQEGVTRESSEQAKPVNLFEPPPLVDDEAVEQTTLSFWVSDADPHATEWKLYGELSGRAEGETQDKFRAYVESAYVLRKLEIAAVTEQGDNFSREQFVKKASNVQMANGVSAELSSEKSINVKLQAYGLVSLLRSTIISDHDAVEPVRSTPSDPPGDDFYGGNFNKVTLLALSTLMRSTSKSKSASGVTTYAWKSAPEEKLAKDIVAGLRSCTIPRSDSYVRNLVKQYHEKRAEYERNRLKRIDPDRYNEAEARRIAAEVDAKRQRGMSKILTAAAELLDASAESPLLTQSSLRTKLEEAAVIPRISADDVKPLLATEDARKPVLQAVCSNGLSESDVRTLLAHESTRYVLLESIASTMTDKEAQRLGQMICVRYKSDPSAAKAAVALKIALAPVLRAVQPVTNGAGPGQPRETNGQH